MSGYLISVMAATLVVALGVLVSYGGRTARLSSAAMGIVLLYTVTVPLISMTSDLSGLLNVDYLDEFKVECDVNDTLFYDRTVVAFSEGVERLVCEKYDLKSDDVYVSARSLDIETMRAEKVIIILSGRAVSADARSIEEAIESAGLGECEVKIDFGK